MINIKHYIERHLQAGLNSLGQLSRTPAASFMTCMVIGITLTLPLILFVILKNAETIQGQFQQSTQMTLYLKNGTSEAEAETLAKQLKNNSHIATATLISPAQGLEELQQQAGFQGTLAELHNNPLPWSIVVTPAMTQNNSLDTLTQNLKQLPEVETLQFDMMWVKRFGALIDLAKHSVMALGVLLSIAVLLIVNNTIRSATQNSQKEIEIIKLIGGTDHFIRRPFLYAGMLYGLLGGVIAWLTVVILLWSMRSSVHNLSELYSSTFALSGLGLFNGLLLLLGSLGLGLAGSWLAVTRYLREYR